MEFCNKLSVDEHLILCAVADFGFASLAILMHIVEAATQTVVLIEGDTYFGLSVREADTFISWVYMGLNFLILFVALVLYIGARNKDVPKCATHLILWVLALFPLGIIVFVLHIIMLKEHPHYFGVVIYPIYYIFKIYALIMVFRFIRTTAHNRTDEAFKIQNEPKLNSGVIRNWTFDHTLKEINLPTQFMLKSDNVEIGLQSSIKTRPESAIFNAKLKLSNGNFVDVLAKVPNSQYQSEPALLKSLLIEAHFLRRSCNDPHPNLYVFHGICAEPRSLTVVTERSSLGTIKDYMKNLQFANLDCDDSPITTSDMINWSHQLASVMNYLQSKKIVIGAMSISKIQLFPGNIVKLSDLELAAYLFNNNYSISLNDLFEMGFNLWKSTAVEIMECLQTGNGESICRFDSKSDAWSFAVTVWEIFSPDETPYGLHRELVPPNLLQGRRLQKPKLASDEIYKIMLTCWDQEPSERPTFQLLTIFFQHSMRPCMPCKVKGP